MMIRQEDQTAYEALESRLKTMLPEQYQECYEDVQPVSMGSAGLKYGEDGKVAWDEIWGSFCDLAMAGGPPHKGALLEPGSRAEIEAQPERYREVVDEICRGIKMVTDIPAEASPDPGWVRLDCESYGMAGWLARAIVMENVSVRCDGTFIELPAGPNYRVEKEIKNVITVIAKTCHYWLDHMWAGQQRDVGNLFAVMAADFPLVQPVSTTDEALRDKIAIDIEQATGLRASDKRSAGWVGFECPDVHAAIWLMRALVVSNVLARREGTVLFVPVSAAVVAIVVKVHSFAATRGVL